jgi:hypothetical protein
MSQTLVGSSGLGLRIAQRNFAPAGPSLEAMKTTRFPTERRASWRERFVAIARQADPARAADEVAPRLPRLRLAARLGAARLGVRPLNTP